VRRFALIIVLAFLTCDLAGLDSCLVMERCASVNDTSPDNNCPPTCVRCACCAQPVVGIPTVVVVHLIEPHVIAEPVTLHLVSAPPHDILHVPKPSSLIA
jgi:hypothetical protein